MTSNYSIVESAGHGSSMSRALSESSQSRKDDYDNIQVSVRNTFIEVESSARSDENNSSPRASSDPGSDMASSSFSKRGGGNDIWMERFSARMNDLWEKASSDQGSDTPSSRAEAFTRHMMAPSSSLSSSMSSHMSTQSGRVSERQPKWPPKAYGKQKPKVNTMNKEGLRSLMKAEAASLTYTQRVSTALQAIDELPEQLEDVLKQTASSVYDDVQGEIEALAQDVVRSEVSSASAGQAVESLEVIPDMVLHSFGAAFAKATDSVRRKVQVVIQDAEEGPMSADQIVSQLRTIPDDVQQLTEQAVEEAVQEVKIHAHKQLDEALQAIPEHTRDLSARTAKLVAAVPNMLPDTATIAKECMVVSVEQAVADVQGAEEPEGPKGTGNQAVSSALLRAKADEHENQATEDSDLAVLLQGGIGNGNSSAAAAAPGRDTLNPGSIGHPELCPRPCLYFEAGQCQNGQFCDFCHLPHPKRPAHLDKRHRGMLKSLAFKECVSMIVRILREKLDRLDSDHVVLDLLDSLQSCADNRSGALCASYDSRPPKERSMLQSALRALSIRSLLTTLHRMAQPDGCTEQQIIDDLLRRLRFQVDAQRMTALELP